MRGRLGPDLVLGWCKIQSILLNILNWATKPNWLMWAWLRPIKNIMLAWICPAPCTRKRILAYEMNAKPLMPKHGEPLRLIIPVKYGIKNLKRIGSITFNDQRPPDYWAEQGYDYYSGLIGFMLTCI
jgi:DMSO/TMAO reductase YedYZ molybdopterin-dependent catalytic subunit